MKCQNCGREMKNGARFCIGCGAQHDENGQLVNSNNGKIDYNKTMMASNMQQNNSNDVDYNKTMMSGSTGFKQYQPQKPQQEYQQNNYQNNNFDVKQKNNKEKKKISPIIIICPIIIVGALAFSFINGKNEKKNNKVETIPETEPVVVETIETEESKVTIATKNEVGNTIHLEGYWSADAEYFYIDGEMQINTWVGDYYVGSDGKKVVNSWVDNKFYVDDTGKKAYEKWIEFTFYGEDGQKKIGYYYVGSDGEKVTNKTVDGRYLNDAGCYWPTEGETIENNSKKKDKIEKSIEETEKNEEDETTTIKDTIKQETSIIPQTAIIPTEQSKVVTKAETNVSSVASDGNSIAYQMITESFPDEKITKYSSVVINDSKYTNLALGVNEWNTNRERTGLIKGETVLDDNISITYDIEVGRNDGKIFSLCETKTKLDNKNAFDKIKNGKTWDANSGQLLSIEDICNGEDKYSELAKLIINKLKSYKSSVDEDVYQEMTSGDPEDIYEYCTWYMTDKGICFIFNSSQIGSKNVGGISFVLTYSSSGNNVNKLLLSKYKK